MLTLKNTLLHLGFGFWCTLGDPPAPRFGKIPLFFRIFFATFPNCYQLWPIVTMQALADEGSYCTGRPAVGRPAWSQLSPDTSTSAYQVSGAVTTIDHDRGQLILHHTGISTSLYLSILSPWSLSHSLADPDMTDGALQARVADLPRNTILLLEDIDAAFLSRLSVCESFSFLSLFYLNVYSVYLFNFLFCLSYRCRLVSH